MKLKIPEKSLFSILLRSEWWKSMLIAAAIVFVGQVLIPEKHQALVTSLALPFIIIGGVSAWRRRHLPSAGRVEHIVEAVTAMSWKEFADLLEDGFRRDGYEVVRSSGAADFELAKSGYATLVSARRWKAASHGLEPLKELLAEGEKKEASAVRYVCLKEPTENAERFARENKIVLIRGAELTRLIRLPKKQ